jgi:hypothetical protein
VDSCKINCIPSADGRVQAVRYENHVTVSTGILLYFYISVGLLSIPATVLQ